MCVVKMPFCTNNLLTFLIGPFILTDILHALHYTVHTHTPLYDNRCIPHCEFDAVASSLSLTFSHRPVIFRVNVPFDT